VAKEAVDAGDASISVRRLTLGPTLVDATHLVPIGPIMYNVYPRYSFDQNSTVTVVLARFALRVG